MEHATAAGAGLDYATHDHATVTTVAPLSVASQPMTGSGSVKPAMIDRRMVSSIIATITGTATTPFNTALQ
jgi:hypothetical protein